MGRLQRRTLRLLGPVALVLAFSLSGTAFGIEGGEIRMTRAADGTLMLVNDPSPKRSGRSSGTSQLPEKWPYSTLIHHFSRIQQLDPKLVAAVIQTESAFRPNAVSSKGAEGLMQLMPATAAELGVQRSLDPAENIRGGTAYIRQMLNRFGSVELALAAYNAGPTAVEKYGGRVPPYEETTHYVSKVLRLYRGAGGNVAKVAPSRPRPVSTRPIVIRRGADGLILVTRD